MKHFVTYAVMDQSLGSNPLFHACLFLSRTHSVGHKIEVTNSWGFYPASAAKTDSLFDKAKMAIGFKFDLQDNFGLIKKEELRFFDEGHGLKGVTFEISQEQFTRLQERCENTILQQQLAIKEAKINLNLEQQLNSIAIFREEKRCAANENRPSRLEPFDVCIALSNNGLSMEMSHTCKTMAIQLLADIGISKQYLDKLTKENASSVIPKFSGNLEDIYFHSVGPLHSHQSPRTGKITLFREWSDDKLYWSLSPQLIALVNSTDGNFVRHHHDYALPEKFVIKTKKVISQLQQIEHIIVNVIVDQQDKEKHQLWVQSFSQHYKNFSILHTHSSHDEIKDALSSANKLLNNLFASLIDPKNTLFDFSTKNKICNLLEKDYEESVQNNDKWVELSKTICFI